MYMPDTLKLRALRPHGLLAKILDNLAHTLFLKRNRTPGPILNSPEKQRQLPRLESGGLAMHLSPKSMEQANRTPTRTAQNLPQPPPGGVYKNCPPGLGESDPQSNLLLCERYARRHTYSPYDTLNTRS